MKKLFLLLTLFGVLCSSCTDSGDDVKNPQRPSPEESVFTISGDGSYVVGAEGGNVVVEVTTNLEYKVVIPEEVSWLTLAESRAVREESLTFIVEKNEELEERSVVVVIVDAQDKELKSLNIKQEAEEPVFTTDSEGNYIIKAEGGDVVVNVTTNLEYDIVIPADASWVTIAESRAVREESLTFSVAKNEETSERIAKILLVDANAETLQEIVFIQEYDVEKVPLNQIWYTSIDGNKIEFNSDDYDEEYADPFNIFGANIVSHEYEDGVGVITFDDEIKKIGEDAFRKCTSLESITIPDSVTEIGYEAFAYCTSLEGITIPDSVVTIREEAFYKCTSLESITIPDSVVTIGEEAFCECTSLESVTIGNGVTEIGLGAFLGCGNLKEFKGKYASEDGRCLIIDGVLKAFAFGCGATEYTIPDSVTTIGDYAFASCSSLTSITIPDSVTTIGEYAFGGCSSLTSITIPDSVVAIGEGAFYVCTSLESVTIGNGVTEIGPDAFFGCGNLKEFKGKYASEDGRCLIIDGVLKAFAFGCGATEYTIPNSVTEIGIGAFAGCTSLESVTIPDSVVTIGEGAFDECTGLKSVTIGNGVTKIGEFAFFECTSLESVTIGNSVTEIGEDAFAKCTSLESITIPDSVVTIGEYAFAVCTSLESVTIGNGVTEIGEATFYACTSLKSVTIGNSVTKIGWRAFEGCTSLESITIPDSVVTIGWNAFDGCIGLKSVTIGNSVTEIGEIAFRECTSLESVTIGNSVTEIGYAAFFGCTSLENVTIPDSVVTIGEYAFCQCTSLESVTIGNSVTEIGEDAFLNCENLEIVYCKPFRPPYLGSGNFDYVQTIYVPAESIMAYKTVDVWYEFADYYIGYDFEKGEVVEPAIPNNTIFYTATSKVEPYSDYFNDYADAFTTFGANIVSHSYENGKGVITFDNDVTKIGEYAFFECKSLESITIPDSVTEIGEGAFFECPSLEGITIPDSVTEIGGSAFGNCSNLKEFKGKYASEDGRCLIVDGVLTSFAPAGLTEYTIPGGVTKIGDGAFRGCTSLEGITIPDSVTEIGASAFLNCPSLESVTIPDSVTEIGVNAFWYCASLESIDIPNSVTEIGDSAFGYCSNLKEFKGKYASEDGRCLIVNGVLKAFAIGCGATEYTIPDSVTVIGVSAFWYCTSLESIYIPNSVTEIGESAFYGCKSLESITIPESVSEIGYAAFAACKSLDESGVYCKSTIPPTCSGDPFETFGFRIYVPKDSVDMYKDAPYWNNYSHLIVAYDYKNNCIYRPEASDIVKTWLGTYSAYTEEIIDIREGIVREQRTDFRFSVEPIDGADDQVYVYGLSVLGSDVPALGHVWTEAGVNYLAFYNQFTVAEFSYGYDPIWLSYCILSDGSYSCVTGDYYPMTFMMSADGTIEGLVSYGEISDGRGCEVVAFDVVAFDFNNGVFGYYYDEYGNPYTQWKHGVVKGITKLQSASVSRKSVDLNQFIVGGQLPCSVVVAQ